MPISRAIERDTREFDTTSLHANVHGETVHRDYSAHFFRWSFARRFVTKTDHVLEIGCGVEKPLSKILFQNAMPLVEHYTGVDLNKLKPTHRQNAEFIGEFNFVRDWKKLRALESFREPGYDVIVHLEVIEHMHVRHGRQMLRACHSLLRPGGVMLMSTPCYDGHRHAANHIHEYTVDELKRESINAGFSVEERFGTFMDTRHLKATSEAMRGLKTDDPDTFRAVNELNQRLQAYYDRDALSCFFAPLFPDHARNNLWVCRKGDES